MTHFPTKFGTTPIRSESSCSWTSFDHCRPRWRCLIIQSSKLSPLPHSFVTRRTTTTNGRNEWLLYGIDGGMITSMIAKYALEYAAIFLILLLVTYVIPAGLFYWLFFVRRDESTEAMRIQTRRHTPQDIRREIKDSVISLLLFSFYSLLLYQAVKSGHTAIYTDPKRYSWWWMPLSFFLAMFLHDSYFYATHRLMHTRALFRLLHAGHHKSITPTPWAILSFQPLETIFQFGFFALLVLFVPMQPLVLLGYVFYDELVNAAG